MAAGVVPTVPVALEVSGGRAPRLTRLVEGALGWPVVGADDVELPPVAVITDVGRAVRGRSWPVPVVLLVGEDDDVADVAAVAGAADTVVPWPTTAERLRGAVLGASPARGRTAVCTIAAACGGVGATTVALALAGLHAWEHGRTLAVLSGPTHMPGAPVVAVGGLASPAVWSAGGTVPGLPTLRVVGLDGPVAAAPEVTEGATVLDVGVAVDGADLLPDVLVVRPDGPGLAAAASSPSPWLVVVGTGPVDRRALVEACPGRVVALRSDPRVAAACLRGRHPTDAPGSWLRPLAPIVDATAGTS